jgi:hypothetical protein
LGEKLSSEVRWFVRSRAAGVLLLVLTAHAFVAGATHFHRLPQPGASAAQQVALGGDKDGGGGAPLGGDERQCLLCRLQRNFVTDQPQATVVIVAPPAWAPVPEHLHEASAREGAANLLRGRAPPSPRS